LVPVKGVTGLHTGVFLSPVSGHTISVLWSLQPRCITSAHTCLPTASVDEQCGAPIPELGNSSCNPATLPRPPNHVFLQLNNFDAVSRGLTLTAGACKAKGTNQFWPRLGSEGALSSPWGQVRQLRYSPPERFPCSRALADRYLTPKTRWKPWRWLAARARGQHPRPGSLLVTPAERQNRGSCGMICFVLRASR
jgi:hypothetical protein